MNKTLIIVESPNKIKKLEEILGSGFKVAASKGHIRDLPDGWLPKSPDFLPEYVITKKDVVKTLKSLVKNHDVILATDLDREGEAIAYHLKEVLLLSDPDRISFGEITKEAVEAALANKTKINMPLVRAQEARRVLDRMVGFKVSPVLSDIAATKLSAGRVQSPALRLIVEREREIEAFTAIGNYSVEFITASYDTIMPFTAIWDFNASFGGEESIWTDKAVAEQVSNLAPEVSNDALFEITDIEKKEVSRKAHAPFTTSTMQQVASTALKIRPDAIMDKAQSLFANGLITYHRTDSMNLSNVAINQINAYLKDQSLLDYVLDSPNQWKEKAASQGAHEAIRPTDIALTQPDIADDVEKALYQLIWTRAVASQMQDKKSNVTQVTLISQKKVLDQRQVFIAKGTETVFDGWTKLIELDDVAGNEFDPSLTDAMMVRGHCELKSKKTKPPGRYSAGSLVKKLEKEEIGRPSTYASIIKNLFTRDYIEEAQNQRLIPQAISFTIIDNLVDRFAFLEYEYTREIEADLDLIASGKSDYKSVMVATSNKLKSELEKLNNAEHGERHDCPKCDGQLRSRTGKHGRFWACNNYPECTYSAPDSEGKPGEKQPKNSYEGTEYPCPVCQKPMHPRTGKDTKTFWGCTGYPSCKATLQDDKGKPAAAFPCPKCDAPLRQLTAKKGKTKGSKFWSCTSFPACKFTTKDTNGQPELEKTSVS